MSEMQATTPDNENLNITPLTGVEPQMQSEVQTSLSEAVTRGDDDGDEQEGSKQYPVDRHGAYVVSLPNPRDSDDDDISWREIIFNAKDDVYPVPEEQLKLKADVESTLSTLQTIFKKDLIPSFLDGRNKGLKVSQRPERLTDKEQSYCGYLYKLVSLAQTGLQTPADPKAAALALSSFQNDVLKSEGPTIKTRYMQKLGTWALLGAVVSFGMYLLIKHNHDLVGQLIFYYRNLLLVWTGTMVGAWVSFGVRNPLLKFDDLGLLEKDMVEPAIRLIFTGLVASIIAFIFIAGIVNVEIGTFASARLLEQGRIALVIGLLLGVSEQALPTTLASRAEQFVGEIRK